MVKGGKNSLCHSHLCCVGDVNFSLFYSAALRSSANVIVTGNREQTELAALFATETKIIRLFSESNSNRMQYERQQCRIKNLTNVNKCHFGHTHDYMYNKYIFYLFIRTILPRSGLAFFLKNIREHLSTTTPCHRS